MPSENNFDLTNPEWETKQPWNGTGTPAQNEKQTAAEMNAVISAFKSNIEKLKTLIQLIDPVTPLDTTKKKIIPAINEIANMAAPGLSWLNLQNEYDIIPFPEMSKDDKKVIRIFEQGSTEPAQDGWAIIGGWNGVRVGHMAMLICMQDSPGGTYAEVGHKYAIIANHTTERQIITVPDHASLPDEVDAILGVLYLTLDTGNLYYFDATAGDYMQIGSVIEGELINDTTFKDTNQNVVVPDGTHLYKDVENTPERYYKWNGVKYEPFEGSSSGLNWTDAEDNAIPYWNGAESKLKVSKIKEHSKGVVNSGIYIAKTKKGNISGDVQLEDAENFIYTMTGNVNFKFDNLTLADDESAVITIQLTGSFAFSFPAGVVAQPYNDTYDGGKTNYLTVVITETVAGAIKGYYSLITA